MESVSARSTVGRIAAEHPLATRVFARHRIDFCCGGGRPLADVCRENGIEVDSLLDEIRCELDGRGDTGERWDEAALADLIDHILSRYHASLREELSRLREMMVKVVRVHGDVPLMIWPLAPRTRVTLLFGPVTDQPVVERGLVVARPTGTLSASFSPPARVDEAARLLAVLREQLASL